MYTLDKKTAEMDFASIFSRLCVNFNVILLFREVIRVALTGLLHTEPVAVEVVGQSPAHILLRAVEHGFQDAGVGGADGFVLVGLEAELAQPSAFFGVKCQSPSQACSLPELPND